MGFKLPRDTPPMERELIYLLGDLCVKWGFCIPPVDAEQISKMRYYNADDFGIDVVEAEGLDAHPGTGWAKRISERFKERFGADEIDVETFTDRVRGITENWQH